MQLLFEMKEGRKVSPVKLDMCSIVAPRDTNTLIFYIFEDGPEYITECSAESGAK